MRFLTLSLLILAALTSNAQTLGGRAAFTFLQLPGSPALAAAGGVNVSYNNNDIGLAINNPALLQQNLHSQLGASFNSFFAGIKSYQLAGAYYKGSWNAALGGGLFYVDYGNISQTDESGSVLGSFRPRDFVVQLSGSRVYLEKWHYGVTAKFIHSAYSSFRTSALGFDVGIHFNDTNHLFSAGLVAKNMGVQLSSYYGDKEELPFDVQIGVSKRLAKAPLGFSATAQQIHRWAIGYSDTTISGTSKSSFLNHFILATHIYVGKSLELTVGYNRLRRAELNSDAGGNGLNGFSAGFKAQFKKIQFQYARAYFQRAAAYNQFGINLNLNKLVQVKDL